MSSGERITSSSLSYIPELEAETALHGPAIHAFLALGFEEWWTGGGCRAMGRNVERPSSPTGYLMVTNGDAYFPEVSGITVGLYTTHDSDEGAAYFHFTDLPSAVEFTRLALLGLGVAP